MSRALGIGDSCAWNCFPAIAAWLKTAQTDSPRDTRLVWGEVTCMMLIEFRTE